MKRIVLAFATFGMLIAGSCAIPSAGQMGGAQAASALSRQAARPGPYAAGRGGPYASATEPGGPETAPAHSIPYAAEGPAYVPGRPGTTDFQLQH